MGRILGESVEIRGVPKGYSLQSPPKSLPGFQLINDGVTGLKSGMLDGQRELTCSKVASYLGYRLVTYSFIPLIANVISTVFSAILAVLTLPGRLCGGENLNDYFFECCADSGDRVYLDIVYDLTYDIRQIGRLCDCDPAFYQLVII